MTFYTLTRDPRFFREVVALHHLKPAAQRAHAEIVRTVVDTDVRPGSADVRGPLRALWQPAAMLMLVLADDCPEALESFIALVTRRRGYRTRPIRLLVRADTDSGYLDL